MNSSAGIGGNRRLSLRRRRDLFSCFCHTMLNRERSRKEGGDRVKCKLSRFDISKSRLGLDEITNRCVWQL